MDSFIVSARKYRPSTFQSVVGQEALTATLRNAIISNKLAHAYLFCGPRGVGKTTCARIFAKTINCSNRTSAGEACNKCESCQSFNEQRSYNIHELDAASNNGVDDIRSINDQVRIPPQIGKYSVYIIDEVHMLSSGAFNAFLKTLEEPPAHAIFILATTEKHKIIPTILSRCQIYDFNRISITDTANHIKYVAAQEGISIDENALNVIAQKSDGGMRDALSIFDQLVSFCGTDISYQATIENLNVLDYEYYFRLVDAMLNSNVSESLLIFNEVLSKGFEAQHFITGFSSHLRDLLVSKDAATIQLLEVGASIGEQYKQQASVCSTDFLFSALNISNECDLNYRISKNKRLLVELALIKICQLNSDKKKVETELAAPALKPIQANTVEEPSTTYTHVNNNSNADKAASLVVEQKPAQTEQPQTPSKPAESENDTIKNKIQNQGAAIGLKRISLNSKKNLSSENVSSEQTTKSAESAEEQSFTESTLMDKWKKFSQNETLDNSSKAFIENHLPTLKDKNTIEIFVDNIFQEKELIQMGILSFLRKELKNDSIQMKIELTPENEFVKPKTPQEIYQRMVSDFPVLEKLRHKLDMEID